MLSNSEFSEGALPFAGSAKGGVVDFLLHNDNAVPFSVTIRSRADSSPEDASTVGTMPWSLQRFQSGRDLHFVTFSCCHRQPLLGTPHARKTFEVVLERVRRKHGFFIAGYVVMPEHVHLLLSEPEVGKLSATIQVIKQLVSRRLGSTDERFWQRRYYDFNVWTDAKRIEKLSYIHRNPVKQGLVQRPEDWAWSSFTHWATGEESVVEIESQWTARKREQNGMPLHVWTTPPFAKPAKGRAPRFK